MFVPYLVALIEHAFYLLFDGLISFRQRTFFPIGEILRSLCFLLHRLTNYPNIMSFFLCYHKKMIEIVLPSQSNLTSTCDVFCTYLSVGCFTCNIINFESNFGLLVRMSLWGTFSCHTLFCLYSFEDYRWTGFHDIFFFRLRRVVIFLVIRNVKLLIRFSCIQFDYYQQYINGLIFIFYVWAIICIMLLHRLSSHCKEICNCYFVSVWLNLMIIDII